MDVSELRVVALAGFALLRAAALGYSRGGGMHLDAIARYQEPLLVGVAAQLFLVLKMAGSGVKMRLVVFCWLGFLATGIISLSERHLSFVLQVKSVQDRSQFLGIRKFLELAPDLRGLGEDGLQASHPDAKLVRRVLEDPILQPVLPKVLKTPLPADFLERPWIFRFAFPLTLICAAILAGWCGASAMLPRLTLKKRTD